MELLPPMKSDGTLVVERQRTLPVNTWSNLRAGRCPKCGNFLKQGRRVYTCNSKSHEGEFLITTKRMQQIAAGKY